MIASWINPHNSRLHSLNLFWKQNKTKEETYIEKRKRDELKITMRLNSKNNIKILWIKYNQDLKITGENSDMALF